MVDIRQASVRSPLKSVVQPVSPPWPPVPDEERAPPAPALDVEPPEAVDEADPT